MSLCQRNLPPISLTLGPFHRRAYVFFSNFHRHEVRHYYCVCVHKDLYGVGPACISPGFPMSLWQLQVLVRSEFDECSTLASVETFTITRCWNFLVCSHAEQLIRTSNPLSWCQRRRGSIPWNFLRRKLWATPTCVYSSERMHWLDGVVHRK